MALSVYFSDESIVNQLRSFFELEEQWTIDFGSLLSQVEEDDEEFYSLKIKGRRFLIHKVLGFVSEDEEDVEL